MSKSPYALAERLKRKVTINANGCWIYKGPFSKSGYGLYNLYVPDTKKQRTVQAHRLSYETFVGVIAAGLEIDHLCGVKPCINPDHLEPVTPKVNSTRANGKDGCGKPGHGPWSSARSGSRGHYCKDCRREQKAQQRAMLAEARGEGP